MSILNDSVLLLNRVMIPLDLISVRRAFFLMSKPRKKKPDSKVATAMEVDEEGNLLRPVSWEEWINLPVQADDRVIHTAKQAIKVPSIITLAEFDRVPIVIQSMNKVSLWKRQRGRCMYTKKPLVWSDCNIDHYKPQSKGGETTWTNCGLTSVALNLLKGNKEAHEVGLKLMLPLTAPTPKPKALDLAPDPRFPEWNIFMPHATPT